MPIEILMPALSPTMTEGNLAKWVKKEGDKIRAGDVIAEIETDKATMEVEAVDAGKIAKIVVPAGTENVSVNSLIAVITQDGEEMADLDSFIAKFNKPAPQKTEAPKAATPAAVDAGQPSVVHAPAATSAPGLGAAPRFALPPLTAATKAISAPAAKHDGARAFASPLAKRIAEQEGIDIGLVEGSGPRGRVVKDDVLKAKQQGAGAGFGSSMVRRNPVEYAMEPVSNMRKVIARRLLEAKQFVPHFYLTLDCTLDKLLEVREDINGAAPIGADGKPAYKVSVNDFVIKAVGLAMRKVPGVNASWTDEGVATYSNIDVSVAVAIEGGLITPIVRNADQKHIVAISTEMKELAAKARANKLKPEEFQGGGFSISNLGMYGIKEFSAIINPPQSCILAVGAGEERVVVEKGQMKIATQMSLTLSVDHRVVDGALGAQYLNALKGFLEKPATLLI
ncbi:MAG: pyruvate dehydrogenase complex dihydrolipoamide acetyltransferase [Alphaproteobacteria bacterium]|nr:pyruvate dehydrogenase complex dihydrolipoamide acetyltransferase [Alphaproteobacteria bacterium]